MTGVHAAVTCDSCHPASNDSFLQFTCVSCHDHEQSVTDRLHASQTRYSYDSNSCLACHPTGSKVPFDHAGVTQNCAQCHDVGQLFAALPVNGFTHPSMGGSDCSSCHAFAATRDDGDDAIGHCQSAPPHGRWDRLVYDVPYQLRRRPTGNWIRPRVDADHFELLGLPRSGK